jgi:hypothetical protein
MAIPAPEATGPAAWLAIRQQWHGRNVGGKVLPASFVNAHVNLGAEHREEDHAEAVDPGARAVGGREGFHRVREPGGCLAAQHGEFAAEVIGKLGLGRGAWCTDASRSDQNHLTRLERHLLLAGEFIHRGAAIQDADGAG